MTFNYEELSDFEHKTPLKILADNTTLHVAVDENEHWFIITKDDKVLLENGCLDYIIERYNSGDYDAK